MLGISIMKTINSTPNKICQICKGNHTKSKCPHQSAPQTKTYKLTRKQKAFADELINNPKMSATQAIKNTYNVTTDTSASVTAHENLRKPSIQLYLDKHIDKAKNRVVELIDSNREDIALRASDSVLDRALGKAVQRSEVQTTGVTLNIDLTSALDHQELE